MCVIFSWAPSCAAERRTRPGGGELRPRARYGGKGSRAAGELKLYDTDPRDAAMVMAIVADALGKP
jgi:hypothetical protein